LLDGLALIKLVFVQQLLIRRLTIYFQRQFSVGASLPINYAVAANELTADVDLQLTEVCLAIGRVRKLHDDVCVRRHVVGTLQVDRRPFSNHAWVLTADGVAPQNRCSDDR